MCAVPWHRHSLDILGSEAACVCVCVGGGVIVQGCVCVYVHGGLQE